MRFSKFNTDNRFSNKAVNGIGNYFGVNKNGEICPVSSDVEINRFMFKDKTVIVLDHGEKNEVLYLKRSHKDGKLRLMSYAEICMFSMARKQGYRFYVV